MRCPVCGSLNDESTRFCSNCGESLQTSESSDLVSSSENATETSSGDCMVFSSKVSSSTEKAPRMSRFWAQMIDSLILMISIAPGLIMILVAAVLSESGNETGSVFAVIVGFGVLILPLILIMIYQLIILTNSGQTIGKRIMKIKIIKSDTGENPGFVNAVIIRSFVPSMINSVVGVFSIVDYCFIFREDQRCIHDLIATTDVVNC